MQLRIMFDIQNRCYIRIILHIHACIILLISVYIPSVQQWFQFKGHAFDINVLKNNHLAFDSLIDEMALFL
jgi:hypothetical protein